MSILARRRKASKFQRAADGSMTLMEHLRELRTRLFRACLAIFVGFWFGYWISVPTIEAVKSPVCDVMKPRYGACQFIQLGVTDYFTLRLKVALWIGLVVMSPIWLYQLWAFIAPGLHRKERRYAYFFIAVATPLFAAGAWFAMFALRHGLEFLLPPEEAVATSLDITRYVDFITTTMLIFGVAFEFPLIILMLNFAGILTGRRMLSWWRAAIFIFFAFAAVATPTPDPFGMTGLAGAMSLLYFMAVGVALLNDRRRGRRAAAEYGDIDDDAISPLDTRLEPVEASAAPVESSWDPALDRPEPVAGPLPVDPRYDDVT